MKKVALCLLLALAMPAMALGLERRDGSYYCTSKFAGGLWYDNVIHQWRGEPFNPEGNFVVKLSFRETVKVFQRDLDAYDVAITKEGSSETSICVVDARLPANAEPPLIDEAAVLSCATQRGVYEYKFNFDNHRFIKIYTAGYTNGANNNKDTPSITGGLCTKISQ